MPTRTGRWCRCGCSGCPADCPPARRWWRCCPVATPTGRRSFSSAGSFATTRRAPEWWPASPRRSPNCASSGATPRSRRTRAISRVSSSGARSWRSNGSSTGCWARSTSRRGWSSRRCWRRRGSAPGSRRFQARPSKRPARCSTKWPPGGAGSPSTCIPTLGRAIFSRGFDPDIDYDRGRGRDDAARRWRPIPRCCCSRTGPISTARCSRWRCRRTGCRRAHTFGGINMAFGFMGPLMRRSGVIFIRRNIATTRCTSTCSRSTSATSSRSGST